MRRRLFLLGMMLCLVLCGCSTERRRAAVEGTVSLANGRPLPSGAIRFIPVDDNHGPVTFAAIRAGAYKLPAERGASIGKNRVEITAFRKSPFKIEVPDGPPGQFQHVDEQYMPAHYNINSAVFADIVAGENKKDFNLDDVE